MFLLFFSFLSIRYSGFVSIFSFIVLTLMAELSTLSNGADFTVWLNRNRTKGKIAEDKIQKLNRSHNYRTSTYPNHMLYV